VLHCVCSQCRKPERGKNRDTILYRSEGSAMIPDGMQRITSRALLSLSDYTVTYNKRSADNSKVHPWMEVEL
jgi:hypothetical protein